MLTFDPRASGPCQGKPGARCGSALFVPGLWCPAPSFLLHLGPTRPPQTIPSGQHPGPKTK